MCGEHPHRSPSSVKYSLSPVSREISLKLQNLDTFSAVQRRKWKLNTYKPEISFLQLLDLKRKHKAALHSWNVDLIHWPWFSFWKQERRNPNINTWCGQAVTCSISPPPMSQLLLADTLARLPDGGGTVHETALLPHFAIHMYGLWIQNSCYEQCSKLHYFWSPL